MVAETSTISHQGLWQGAFGTVISMGLFMGSILAHPNVRFSKAMSRPFGACPTIIEII